MTITGDKMYAGEIKHTFRIEKKPLDSSDIEIEKIKPKTYTGSAITPAITVKYDQAPGGKVNPSNYTVSYANNKEIGTANITITAKANSGFTGSIKTTFTIEPIRFESDTLTVSGIVNKTYTGANHTQNVVVKLGNKQLIPDTDYTISYSNNKNVGTATMTITGKGHYQGTAKRTFQIYASNSSGGSLKPFSSASISSSHMTRNATGKALAPSITVKYGNTTLKAGTHYYLTYNGSTSVPTKAGSYTVKAIGKQENGYSGEKTVGTFRILQGPASGTVRFTSMSNSNYVLDAHGASPKIGANVTIWSDNGGNNQKWVLSLGSDGYYTIKSTYDQKFLLDASGATPRQGSNVSIWTTNSGNNQKWILEPSGSSYIIRNAANPNLVLDATGAKPKQGANVTVWGSNNGNNQKWKVVPVKTPSFDANKTYEITSLSNSNYTLDASGATPKRGANVSIWTKNGGKNQRWYLVPDGKGYYTIRSSSNRNYVLDASGAKPKQGANVSIWDSNGGNNQKWKIEQLASGAYVIKSAANQSYVLDASGATPKRGANISVWSANGGNNQKWNIRAV